MAIKIQKIFWATKGACRQVLMIYQYAGGRINTSITGRCSMIMIRKVQETIMQRSGIQDVTIEAIERFNERFTYAKDHYFAEQA